MAEKIGLIAGNGQFPILFARAAVEKGWQVVAVAYRGEADPALAQYANSIEWLYLGQVKKLISYFRRNNIQKAVMMGGIKKTKMFTNIRPDIKAISLVTRMKHTHDDAVLRAFADLLEKEGIQIQPSTLLLPELLSPPGIWTTRRPTRAEFEDIKFGWTIAKAVGRLDIGQCVVVGGGSVLAVEAIDGTDATIARGGALSKGHAVVVKVCKPIQDTRFDIPAIGLGTIETMHNSDVKVLAIEAGKSVVFDRQAMIELANSYKMAITALTDDQIGNLPQRQHT